MSWYIRPLMADLAYAAWGWQIGSHSPGWLLGTERLGIQRKCSERGSNIGGQDARRRHSDGRAVGAKWEQSPLKQKTRRG